MTDWKTKLKEAKELLDMGFMTEAEFQTLRQKALSALGMADDAKEASFTGGTQMGKTPAPFSGPTKMASASPPVESVETASQMGLAQGMTIGSYHIIESIGKGGMGEVYRARHKIPEFAAESGDVAIKLILPQHAQDQAFRRRFIREASVGKKANHPGIAKVLDIIAEQAQLALVMEFVPGKELAELVSSGGISVEATLGLLKPIAEAVDHIHSLGVIHRDIKPTNIKLRADGAPVILDFGIAKDEKAKKGMTKTGMTMGTVGYMAPEQMDAKNVGPAADQYALGIIAYALMTGGFPWGEEETEYKIYAMKVGGQLVPLSEKRSEITQVLSEVVAKALSPKPEDRFENCSAFVSALEKATQFDAETTEEARLAAEAKAAEEARLEAEAQAAEEESLASKWANYAETAAAETVPLEVAQGKSKVPLILLALAVLAIIVFVAYESGDNNAKSSQSSAAKTKVAAKSKKKKDTKRKKKEHPKAITAKLGFLARLVPAGSFTMGSPASEKGRLSGETQHKVRITRPFYMMQSEVTQGLYKKVMGTNPSRFRDCGLDCPVEKVSWFDMVRFANALSKKEGFETCYQIKGETVSWPKGVACTGWRLPTEAEWEYAARGGDSFVYAGSDAVDAVAWYTKNSEKKTHPVCKKKKNGHGLCDMSGNVKEWVWDGYGTYPKGFVTDPKGPESASLRVIRGGSWNNGAVFARVAFRAGITPSFAYDIIGARLLRSLEP